MFTTSRSLFHRGCRTCISPSQHEPKWISNPEVSDPERPRNRTLVLCLDGTGDSPDNDDSNVVQFVATLKVDPTGKEQVVHYEPGIGTSGFTKLLDKATARTIDDQIKAGYKFLMGHYQAGDQICLFGFSRGAYAARALAGMLQKVGLLPLSKSNLLDKAYDTYERDDGAGRSSSAQFKQTFSIDVKVKFLGVWDTVESVLGEKSLPFSGSSDTIQVFRHALSLDEHRVKFKPSFCTGGKREDQRTEDETDVKEVFFAGAHSDVGGGSVKNGTRHSLARISLRWMIRECFINQTGIIFDAHMVNQVGLDINSIDKAPEALSSAGRRSSASARFSLTSVVTVPALWLWNKVPQFRPLPARKWDFEGEAQEELNDALSPINDQLKIHPIWYLMELVRQPTKKEEEEEDGSRVMFNRHLGKGRIVDRLVMNRGLKVHRSVKALISACGADGGNEGYLPQIRCEIKDGEEARSLEKEEWLADKLEHFEWVD